MPVLVISVVFWYCTPYTEQREQVTVLKMEAVGFSESMVSVYKTKRLDPRKLEYS
jgi:hypothetical protein